MHETDDLCIVNKATFLLFGFLLLIFFLLILVIGIMILLQLIDIVRIWWLEFKEPTTTSMQSFLT